MSGGCSRGKVLEAHEVSMVLDNGIVVDKFGRSSKFTPFRIDRPWFRSFHFSWFSFFLAFVGWFSIVPALEIMVADKSNDIDTDARKTSNIVSVLGTVFLRLAIGPMLERWGPRRIQSILLFYGGIMVMLSSTVNTAVGLYCIRFAISFVGAAFVPCQYWTSMMFSQEVVGQANAFAGGWGNLGGGFTSVFVAALITGYTNQFDGDEDKAWRFAVGTAGFIMLLVSLPMWKFSDDCPQGHWNKRLYGRKDAVVTPDDVEDQKNSLVSKTEKIPFWEKPHIQPWLDWRVWILFLQYAACFGVELTINNSMTSYLYKNFVNDENVTVTIDGEVEYVDCSTDPTDSDGDFVPECSILGNSTAAMIAGLFGLMNLFARALGGLLSDNLNRKFNMRGRLWAQFICLTFEGFMLIIFSRMTKLEAAIPMLILFSVGVQSSEGTTFSLVPYFANIGVVSGITGAGGNAGAVSWSTMLRFVDSTSDGYLYLGFIVLGCALFTFVLTVNGTGIFVGPNPVLGEKVADDNVSEAGSEDLEGSYHKKEEEETTTTTDENTASENTTTIAST